ncbi:MAG: peptidylprolyl isomerase [Chthoniobacteraceae bacterium]
MMSRPFLTTLALSVAFALSVLPAFADSSVELDSLADQSVPAGKSLVIPLTASASDGTPLSFAVTSSDSCVIARVKSGLSFLQLNITHSKSTQTGDTDYNGAITMALFRDWTPHTAQIIGGLAQSGYYDELTFHRLAVTSDYSIIQGGDPLGTGKGGPGFTFSDEFVPQLMFAGDAQLAMANSGHDTNGSQFFLTSGTARLFDFDYTIFGQLTRNRDLLTSMFDGTAVNSTSPYNPVTITSATVLPRTGDLNSDAMLVLSAPAVAGGGTSSTITVSVSDRNGNTDTQTFVATPTLDTTDDPPILAAPLLDKISPAYTLIKIPMSYIDLEDDAVAATGTWISSHPGLTQTIATLKAFYLLPPPSFTGPLELQLGFYEIGDKYRSGAQTSLLALADTDFVKMSVGDSNYTMTSMVGSGITEETAAPFTLQLAKIAYSGTANPSHFGATINWGDSTSHAANISVATITKVNGQLVISGSHTYSTAGIYPVRISLYDIFAKTSAIGVTRELDLTACVTDATSAPLAIQGLTLTVAKPKAVSGSTPPSSAFDGQVATFKDVNATNTAATTDYDALIDWGDGTLSTGAIDGSSTAGFTVTGQHTYTDSDAYSIATRIVRKSDSMTGYGYGRLIVSGTATSLPPFRNVDLQGKWLSMKTYNTVENGVSVGHIIGQFKVTNKGTIDCPIGATATLYYSTDAFYDDGTDTQIVQVTVNNIAPIKPGKSVIISFKKNVPAPTPTPSPTPTATPTPTAITKFSAVNLPSGVDMTNPSTTSSTIITQLQASYPDQAIDVTHNIVTRPSSN